MAVDAVLNGVVSAKPATMHDAQFRVGSAGKGRA